MSLCPEGEERSALSNKEFWARVAQNLWDGNYVDLEVEEFDVLDYVAMLVEQPCTVCGEKGPCGYDSEGRPMIHTEEGDKDE